MKIWILAAFAWLLVGASTASLAIKRRPQATTTCESEMESLRTELRLRTAELEVARGMLRSAERKLELCRVKVVGP